ncbi:hypothetical protein F2Q69_00062365 [Brassica cretica]|uniref:Uncharacterized protein n=1 Tax=Brassica cretica TaxID=69181 RepID=A0A8S9RG23_BRACR|nr:hypothetical protein F2Q69_00062365 [Brassica cretica]
MSESDMAIIKPESIEVEERVDERSVDDLLSFINGRDHKVVNTSTSKKKNKKRKEHKNGTCKVSNKDSHNLHSKQRSVDETSSSLGGVSNLHNIEDDIFSKKAEFEDGYIDDEIDPALKEMLDREVEDFARRLNSSWVLSVGQERQPVHFSINGNGDTRRLTGTHTLSNVKCIIKVQLQDTNEADVDASLMAGTVLVDLHI